MNLIKKSSKIISIILITLIITSGFLLPLFLTRSNIISNIVIDLKFEDDNAFLYVRDQVEINQTYFRTPGTQGREKCAQYFVSKFQEIELNFSYVLHNFTIHSVECQNVLFKLNENYDNIVILASHYDSRAKATKDPVIGNRIKPVPGANDGASGCGVLIELARVLFEKKINLSCQIWFLFFDAEDQGYDYAAGIEGWDWCEGSTAFVNSINSFYNSSNEYFDCMILLDMVGGENLQFINEQYSTSSLLNEIFEIGRQLGYTIQFPTDAYSARITDDHVAFVNYGIPSADLIIKFWDNPNWPYHHTIQDDLSHISNMSLDVSGKTIEQFIYNNYLDIPSNNYKGNFPWKEDINQLDTDFIIFIIIISALIGLPLVLIFSIRWLYQKKRKRN
ncbi:MAG: M28 family peptidase [Promethearchaeota archaeon]